MEFTYSDVSLSLITIEEARALVVQGYICYDNTKLTAINTCPTYGVLRYALHRTETSSTTSRALTAGKACHDYFAALRFWQLRKQYKDNLQMLGQIGLHANKVIGSIRYAEALDAPQDTNNDLQDAINFSLPILYSSGFYDDPSDRRRTMANLENACIAYTSRCLMSEMPVIVQDSFIGIEFPFCILFRETATSKPLFVYTGRVDGLHYYNNVPYVCENKTAYRLDNTWRMSFHVSNQVTGYMVAASLALDREVRDGFVMGAQIPQPKSFTDGIAFEQVSRTDSDIRRWVEWALYSVDMYKSFVNSPTNAPRFSHSCNRYFHPCQFIPYCTMHREEQANMIEQMKVEEWSPLDHVGELADTSTGDA